MKRREFFRKMGLGAVGLAAAPVVGKALADAPPKKRRAKKRAPKEEYSFELTATNTVAFSEAVSADELRLWSEQLFQESLSATRFPKV